MPGEVMTVHLPFPSAFYHANFLRCLCLQERAALSHGEALHLSAGVDRHTAGPEPRQNSRFAPQPRPLQGSGGQPASTKGGGPSLRPHQSRSSTGRSVSMGRTPKPTSDAQRLGAQMPPSQPQFKLAQIRGIGGGANGGGSGGPNVAPPLAQQRSADELEERRRKREEARANNRQKNMVSQGGGGNGNGGAVKSPFGVLNGATSDGDGVGSNSRDGAMPRRKSRFDSGSRASSSQDSMQRAAALVAQARSGAQQQHQQGANSAAQQQPQQPLNQGRSAAHPPLTYSRSGFPGHHPGGANQSEELKDEGESSEEDEATVADRVGTSAVVFWAAPKPRPPALGPRQGYRLGQRPEYGGGYGGGPYGGAGGYYGQPLSHHLQSPGGGNSSGGRGGAAKPPPAKLHVTVKSAVNLLNVQLLGTQDPMVSRANTSGRLGVDFIQCASIYLLVWWTIPREVVLLSNAKKINYRLLCTCVLNTKKGACVDQLHQEGPPMRDQAPHERRQARRLERVIYFAGAQAPKAHGAGL